MPRDDRDRDRPKGGQERPQPKPAPKQPAPKPGPRMEPPPPPPAPPPVSWRVDWQAAAGDSSWHPLCHFIVPLADGVVRRFQNASGAALAAADLNRGGYKARVVRLDGTTEKVMTPAELAALGVEPP